MGAWIETTAGQFGCPLALSLPSWERGLKLCSVRVLPEILVSLPSWERGLKPVLENPINIINTSLPSWERGLKLPEILVAIRIFNVAPFMGAWIETGQGVPENRSTTPSLPSWERGLKLVTLLSSVLLSESLPSWERGLKHKKIITFSWHKNRRSLHGSVD